MVALRLLDEEPKVHCGRGWKHYRSMSWRRQFIAGRMTKGLDWSKDRARRLARSCEERQDEHAFRTEFSRKPSSPRRSKSADRALVERAVALAQPTKARVPERTRVKFFGTRPAFEKIILALSDFVEIRHLSDDRVQIALDQGVYITWFLSTKTVQFQGAGKAAKTFKMRFLRIAGPAATEERRR